MNRRENALLLIVVSAGAILIGYISLTRDFFSYSTETDFLGGFMLEAKRLLNGEPLALEFHPPFYATVLALIQWILDDWFLSGRLLSLFSYLISLISSFYFFKILCGRVAGWGALFALMSSSLFVYYSTLATSDIFFYALYSSSLLLALLAYKNKSVALWVWCGVFVGLVVLTRSNGFTLLALLLLPWLGADSLREKGRLSIFLLVGILSPLLLWAGIASYTGSPFMPSGTYANLALTYFSPEESKIAGEARKVVEAQFDNLWHVLSYDPLHIAKSYFRDLVILAQHLLLSDRIIGFPVYLFLIPGLLILALRTDRVALFYLFILTLSQILLVNFKGYENRLYLFMVPLYGVALAVCWEKIFEQIKIDFKFKIPNSSKAIVFTALLVCVPAILALKTAVWKSRAADHALSDPVTNIKKVVSKGAWVVARNPQIPFHVDGRFAWFPNVKTFRELNRELAKFAADGPLYIYFGRSELKRRPQFHALISGDSEQYSWLLPIMYSSEPGKWVLYEYKPLQ